MHRPPFWRDRKQNERFVGFECGECGYVSFPEEPTVCKECSALSPGWEEVQLQERGVVQALVVQNQLPDEFEAPLPIAVIDVPTVDGTGSARVYGHFTETDGDDIGIGTEVEADFRRMFEADGLPIHSFKFKPARGDRP